MLRHFQGQSQDWFNVEVAEDPGGESGDPVTGG
jgi:hypothetical protein